MAQGRWFEVPKVHHTMYLIVDFNKWEIVGENMYMYLLN